MSRVLKSPLCYVLFVLVYLAVLWPFHLVWKLATLRGTK